MGRKLCKCRTCVRKNPQGEWVDSRTYREHGIAEDIHQAMTVPTHPPGGTILQEPDPAAQRLRDLRRSFENIERYSATSEDLTTLVFTLEAVDPKAKKNKPYHRYRTALQSVKAHIEQVDGVHEEVLQEREALLSEVNEALRLLDDAVGAELRRRNPPPSMTSHPLAQLQSVDTSRMVWRGNEDVLLLGLGIMLAVLHFVYNVAMKPCVFVLRSFTVLLHLSSTRLGGSSFIPPIPLDLRTILSRCMETPVTTMYVCCPECSALYVEEGDKYPDFCTNVDLGQICGRRLVRNKEKNGQLKRKPIRRFRYRHLTNWLAELACRPGMESLLDQPLSLSLGTMEDIRDGGFAARFRGADGAMFLGSPGNILLALGIDWFNPFGNRQAKKKRSVGGMWVCVQNLPIEIRHRPENICVLGIIPGPHEPSQVEAQINHFLRPLVDELRTLYHPGFRLLTTPRFPLGRILHVALGQIIADTQASHAIGGFTPITHTLFCTICYCTKQQLPCFDKSTFKPRNSSDPQSSRKHHDYSVMWRDAQTLAARQKIETMHGARWTELYRLPYWDSPRQVMIDPMHLFSGSIKYLCRDVWGMNVKLVDDDASGLPINFKLPPTNAMVIARETLLTKSMKEVQKLSLPQLQTLAFSLGYSAVQLTKGQLERCLQSWRVNNGVTDAEDNLLPSAAQEAWTDTLLEPSPDIDIAMGEKKLLVLRSEHAQLKTLRLDVLREMCRIRSIPFDKDKKADLAAKLLQWRHHNAPPSPSASLFQEVRRAARRTGAVLGRDTLEEVREDLAKTIFPSHIKRTPMNLGRADHGKLTAEEWFSTCWYSLPITLVRLWVSPPQDSEQDRGQAARRLKMIRHFAMLVKLSKLALHYVITPQDIEDYKACVTTYLQGLRDIYDWARIRPQHHLLLHIDEMLLDAGPNFSWSAWYSEYMNGLAQDVPTNWKFGELEDTIFNRLSGLSQIRARLIDNSLPEELSGLRSLFTSTVAYFVPTAPVEEGLCIIGKYACRKGPSVTLEPDSLELRLLQQHSFADQVIPSVSFCQEVRHEGATYRPQNGDTNIDAYVEVMLPGRGCFAARIESLFVHNPTVKEELILAVVSLFEPLERQQTVHDPYRSIPELGAYLVRSNFLKPKELVPMESVLAHTVVCPYKSNTNELRDTTIVVPAMRRSK